MNFDEVRMPKSTVYVILKVVSLMSTFRKPYYITCQNVNIAVSGSCVTIINMNCYIVFFLDQRRARDRDGILVGTYSFCGVSSYALVYQTFQPKPAYLCLSHNRAAATIRRVSFSIWSGVKPPSYARRTAAAARL